MDDCRAKLTDLRSQLCKPSTEGDWSPSHQYSLRGIVTGPETMYLCQRLEPALIERKDAGPVTENQWWRLAYQLDADQQIVTEVSRALAVAHAAFDQWLNDLQKTTFEAVQQAIANETDKPVIIYANEKAMTASPLPLNGSLGAFVKFDNRLFKQDIIEEAPRDRSRDRAQKRTISTPASPPKRSRQRSDSIDSMAANRSSDDEAMSDRDEEDLPTAQHFEDTRYTFGDILDDGPAFSDPRGEAPPQETEPSVNTEMVELAIRRPMDEDSESGQDSEGTSQQDPRFIADWDNPEGKVPPGPQQRRG